MPIKVEGRDRSIHSDFWGAIAGTNSDSLALSQLWLCTINRQNLEVISSEMATYMDTYEPNMWNTSQGQSAVNSAVLHNKNFSDLISLKSGDDGNVYLFAQGVSFIADGLTTSRIGTGQIGATKGLITEGRLDLNATNITFLESNVSFVDGFIRPWSVLVGHRSLKCAALRCNIAFHCLEKWSLMEPLKVRKTMFLRNAVPINIDAEEYNYSGDKIIERHVQFAFDRYEMEIRPQTTTLGITPNDIKGLMTRETDK